MSIFDPRSFDTTQAFAVNKGIFGAREVSETVAKIDPETGRPDEGLQVSLLRADTGYYVVSDGYATNKENDGSKEKKERAELARKANEIIVDGISMSYEDVMHNLDIGINTLQATINKPIPVVSQSAMLYVDAQGKVVPAGTPGAQQVATAEQKATLEDANSVCYGGLTAQDISLVDGKPVPTELALLRQAQEENLAELKTVQEDLQSGKITLEELQATRPDLVAQLAEIQKTGTLESEQEPIAVINGVVLELPGASIAKQELIERYQPQTPEPAMAPAPPSFQ